jgi:hypothetical protein
MAKPLSVPPKLRETEPASTLSRPALGFLGTKKKTLCRGTEAGMGPQRVSIRCLLHPLRCAKKGKERIRRRDGWGDSGWRHRGNGSSEEARKAMIAQRHRNPGLVWMGSYSNLPVSREVSHFVNTIDFPVLSPTADCTFSFSCKEACGECQASSLRGFYCCYSL